MCEQEQALADKMEVKKQADEDVERLWKEVKVFKIMKYRDGYNDKAQCKPLRYPLEVRSLRTDQVMVKVLAPPMHLLFLTPPPLLR